MKIIRNLIYKIFGLEQYLKLVSSIYLRLVHNGFLKKSFPELFYLKEIVKKDYCCIDIGANLGYYSTMLSKIVGNAGKVYAVEPVPLFGKILQKNINRFRMNNIEVFPYALGEKEDSIKMGMPEKNGVIHHGMTKVASSADESYVEYFNVNMKVPDKLFGSLEKLDFVKCDVEGYESIVFLNMSEVLKKHKPLVQTELNGKENRDKVFDLFNSMNYSCFILKENILKQLQKENIHDVNCDFYFLPKSD